MPPHLHLPELALATGLLALAAWMLAARRGQQRRDAACQRQLLALDREWRLRAEQLEQRLEQLAAEAETVTPWRPAGGLNRMKRTEALFMLRRGDAPASVAAALAMPRNELDLLLRIQDLRSAPAAGHPAKRESAP
jgi:hypothetical protein